jgi:glycosyltransferase involved in cell wall biosynthesis
MCISKLGIRNNLVVLGMLPHAHLHQLMRQSLAVLQPSLFEGWSTTVEEVKSIGKRIIISDIPVHREQNPPRASFFSAQDAQQLAEILVKTFDEAKPGPDLALESQARAQLPARIEEYGRSFLEIVNEATG